MIKAYSCPFNDVRKVLALEYGVFVEITITVI